VVIWPVQFVFFFLPELSYRILLYYCTADVTGRVKLMFFGPGYGSVVAPLPGGSL
jgi:hypothetical protein